MKKSITGSYWQGCPIKNDVCLDTDGPYSSFRPSYKQGHIVAILSLFFIRHRTTVHYLLRFSLVLTYRMYCHMENKKTHFRWVVIALLFTITVVNYIDRSSIGYAIDSIAKEFHLSQSNIGLILGAFGIGYVFTTFLGGIAADRYGSRRTLLIATFFWTVATGITGLASGFSMVFFARIILGLAEGPNFPGLTRAISDWLPEKERTRALSYTLISVPLALALGGPVASQLVLLFSWRGAYFILTGVGLLWLPFWWLLFRDKPSDSKHVNQAELMYIQQNTEIKSQLTKEHSPWRVLLLNKTLLVNNWSFFVFGFYLFFFMTWLPNYLSQTFHVTLAKIGIYTMFPWLLAAGMIWCVGVFSDWIFTKTKSLRLSRSYPIMISQLCSVLCIIPVIYSSSVGEAMIYISLAAGFAMSANGSFFAVNVDIAKERAGTALGIMEAIFAISGFLAPTITGFIVSWTGHFEAVFWLLASLALSSVGLIFVFHNRNETARFLKTSNNHIPRS